MAAQVLVERYGQSINRMVWRLLGADAEHDDVVHQVLINILESIKKLKRSEKLQAWILGLTINTVRGEIRSRRLRRRTLKYVDAYPEACGSPDEQENRVLVKRFFEVLSRMRTNDRILFILRFVESYKLEEIATMMGMSMTTTKRKLTRARRTFLLKARRDVYLAQWVEKTRHE